MVLLARLQSATRRVDRSHVLPSALSARADVCPDQMSRERPGMRRPSGAFERRISCAKLQRAGALQYAAARCAALDRLHLSSARRSRRITFPLSTRAGNSRRGAGFARILPRRALPAVLAIATRHSLRTGASHAVSARGGEAGGVGCKAAGTGRFHRSTAPARSYHRLTGRRCARLSAHRMNTAMPSSTTGFTARSFLSVEESSLSPWR